MDLLIAATAKALRVPLISLDEDLSPLADVVDLRRDPGERADLGTPG
jgi:predicted nucleic acid-binding protein